MCHQNITSAGLRALTMDRDLSNFQCFKCSMFGRYRRNYPKHRISADNIINILTDDTARAVNSKKKNEGSGGDIYRSYNKTTTHCYDDYGTQRKQHNSSAIVITRINPRMVESAAHFIFQDRIKNRIAPILLFRQSK